MTVASAAENLSCSAAEETAKKRESLGQKSLLFVVSLYFIRKFEGEKILHFGQEIHVLTVILIPWLGAKSSTFFLNKVSKSFVKEPVLINLMSE